ncbi:hypothetical protein FA13DRAFT_1720202 [Coprinellus micaceus]|uniref:Ankyrin n=1 Tax=Coprinellus micaceus TaxID=71717 RepID=A0A4Y7SAL1_COPMI|nr:hypothetical protein FA13DRAFT_1720202 [Coprinellus micaceus]
MGGAASSPRDPGSSSKNLEVLVPAGYCFPTLDPGRARPWEATRTWSLSSTVDPTCVRFTYGEGKTVLHHAAQWGCEELVLLISNEFCAWVEMDGQSLDNDGKSAMDYAMEAGER